jgi:anaerobic selenocysteine-containing dehydrogenase
MQLIYRALMRQELVVVHEHVHSPTAQLADYILPGDSWLERAALLDGMGWVSSYRISQQAIEPPGECRSVFAFWRDLAHRFGLQDTFPWNRLEDLLDARVARTGRTFAQLVEEGGYPGRVEHRK